MRVTYRCPKCGTTGHDEVYRIGRGKDDGVYACLDCWKKWGQRVQKKEEEE